MREPARVRHPEWMDQPGVGQRELSRSLRDLQRVNRWFGGSRVALDALDPLLFGIRAEEAQRVRVLDVATGSGDIPLAIAKRARQRGIRLTIVATDLHPGTLALARAHTANDENVSVEQANALALGFPDDSFDIAMCHTALHHFDPPDAIRALQEMARVSRRAVVVTDLVRSWTGLGGVRLLAATVWRNHPITRHDGPASFRAAYTQSELRTMAREAGLTSIETRSYRRFARMSLVGVPALEVGTARFG